MIYFTADLHLGHRGIIAMKNRPFRTVEEMNRALIMNFNAVVSRRDTVYILGDICHHLDVESCNGLIRRLNGEKILLSGNHDKQYDSSLFAEIRDFMTVSLNGVSFSLMHYPMLSCRTVKPEQFSFMVIYMHPLIIMNRTVKMEY